MAFDTYTTLKWLHVLFASVVVGYFAILPMIRARLKGATDPALHRASLDLLKTLDTRLALPSIGLLLVTGLVMTLALPESPFQLATTRWAVSGLVLAIILGILVALSLGGAVRRMLVLADKGEIVGPDADKAWGDWRVAVLSGALLSVVAVGLMVFKPGF